MNYVQNNHSFVHFDGIVNHLPESLTMGIAYTSENPEGNFL